MEITPEKINKAMCLADQFKIFRECYEDCKLWGGVDEPVSAEKLLLFLLENPHFQQIAEDIRKLI